MDESEVRALRPVCEALVRAVGDRDRARIAALVQTPRVDAIAIVLADMVSAAREQGTVSANMRAEALEAMTDMKRLNRELWARVEEQGERIHNLKNEMKTANAA